MEAGMAGGLPNWNMEPPVGVKLAPEVGGVPKRKGWEVEAVVLVTLLRVLVTLLTPKLKAGFGAESVEVLAVLTEVTVEVAVAWPVKRGALVVAARGAVCLKKGVNPGIDVGGPTLLKIGLKAGAGLLVVVGRVELEDATAVTVEGLEGKGSPFSLFGGATKMGLNVGDAEDTAGATEAGGLAAGVLSIPNRILCLGLGGGVDRAWDLADVSAEGDLAASVMGPGEEAGVSPKTAVVDLESEEVAGTSPDCEELSEARGLGVFGGESATVVVTPAGSGREGRPGEFCIFFKLSNSGLALGAWREVGDEAVPTAGEVKVKED